MTAVDVLVVGAGPAGCAAAIRAAKGGLSVALLHQPRVARSWAGESLPPGMARPIRAVFGNGIVSEGRHRPAMGTRSVWGSDTLVETDFLRNPLGAGWLLDRAGFDAEARAAALAAGVTVVEHRRGAPVGRTAAGWRVGDGIDARFAIDATGRSASLLRAIGIRRVAADRQIALVAAFADSGDGYAGTTIEAVAEGWWYTTPLARGRRVLAYLTDADLWRAGPRNWPARLAATRHMARCAGADAFAATPVACPAETRVAARFAGADWMAVGDAAASFDPLSSQGIATAVMMGARAGDALARRDRAEALADWSDAYEMIVAEHASFRAHHARQERRWPGSAFWRRRRPS